MTTTAFLVYATAAIAPAMILRRHIRAMRTVTQPAAGPAVLDDPLMVRRIPADIAGAFPLEPRDKDTSRALLTAAATPAAHRYAAALVVRSMRHR